MDITFTSVTITFFAFLGIAYYLDVIKLSIPIVMIYFIFCFGYFISEEKSVPEAKNTITRNGSKIIKNNNKKSSKITNGTLEYSKNAKENSVEPKPIVSSLPKPIVIEPDLVEKNNSDLKKVKSKVPVVKDSSNEKVNEKPINTLKLNEMMICRGIYKRNPIKPGIKFINNVDSLFCYTKISNSGSKQEVKHIWYFENKEITTVSYNIKTSYNYRSWSKKTIYPNQTGKWRVDVSNKAGDVLGSREFTINSINTAY
tara:strand:+ start:78 stop:845 length:768 start_codon:yes stop_codon:yes gene_type:complete